MRRSILISGLILAASVSTSQAAPFCVLLLSSDQPRVETSLLAQYLGMETTIVEQVFNGSGANSRLHRSLLRSVGHIEALHNACNFEVVCELPTILIKVRTALKKIASLGEKDQSLRLELANQLEEFLESESDPRRKKFPSLEAWIASKMKESRISTQQELAALLGIDQADVSRINNGKVSLWHLIKLAQTFETTAAAIIERIEPSEPLTESLFGKPLPRPPFAKWLESEMLRRNIFNISDLARRIGVSSSIISNDIQSATLPNTSLKKYSDFFEIPLVQLKRQIAGSKANSLSFLQLQQWSERQRRPLPAPIQNIKVNGKFTDFSTWLQYMMLVHRIDNQTALAVRMGKDQGNLSRSLKDPMDHRFLVALARTFGISASEILEAIESSQTWEDRVFFPNAEPLSAFGVWILRQMLRRNIARLAELAPQVGIAASTISTQMNEDIAHLEESTLLRYSESFEVPIKELRKQVRAIRIQKNLPK